MKKKTLKQVLEETALEVVTDKIKDYRKEVNNQINSALLSIIGLEKRGNNSTTFEIDHCNGRNSVLIDAFRNIAKDEAEKIARTYKPSKEDLVGFREAFAKEYRNQIMYSIRDMAKSKASADFREFADSQKIDVSKIVEEALSR